MNVKMWKTGTPLVLGVFGAMSWWSCAGPARTERGDSTSVEDACAPPPAARMKVVYGPGCVMVAWEPAAQTTEAFADLEAYVLRMTQRARAQFARSGDVALLSVADGQGAGYVIRDADPDRLDQARTRLDLAARHFDEGVCDTLVFDNAPLHEGTAFAARPAPSER